MSDIIFLIILSWHSSRETDYSHDISYLADLVSLAYIRLYYLLPLRDFPLKTVTYSPDWNKGNPLNLFRLLPSLHIDIKNFTILLSDKTYYLTLFGLRDFRLQLRSKRDLCCSGILLTVRWQSKTKTKLRGFSPRANHTDRAAAAGRRS